MMGTRLAPRSAYEMDYNTGATAGIAEMLLQSHAGYLALLPALPSAWPNGEIMGLCGRGGFVVDLTWQNSALKQAQIHSSLDGLCRVRPGVQVRVVCNGQDIPATQVEPHIIEFPATAGAKYQLTELP